MIIWISPLSNKQYSQIDLKRCATKKEKKITLGADLETGSARPPHSPLLVMRPLPEIPAVIGVWIAVFGHHHPVGKLPACQPLHGLLGVKNWCELHKDLKFFLKIKQQWGLVTSHSIVYHKSNVNGSYLAGSRHFQAIHRSRYLNAFNLAVLAALIPDVLHNLLILFIIQQLFRGHHVHQTQHLRGQAAHLSHGAVQTWHLQRHWSLVYTRLEGDTQRLDEAFYSKAFSTFYSKLYKANNLIFFTSIFTAKKLQAMATHQATLLPNNRSPA